MPDILSLLAGIAIVLGLYEFMRVRERLHSTEAKLDALLRHFNVEWGRFSEPSDHVKQLAKSPATRIQAIKAYREQTGLGLKDAVKVIDGLASE